jgi:hypothetical protein
LKQKKEKTSHGCYRLKCPFTLKLSWRSFSLSLITNSTRNTILSLHHERRKMNFIFPCKISFHHQHANDNENEIYTFFLSPNYYYLKKK